MEKIHTDKQRADILMKPLAESRFLDLSVELGLLDLGENGIIAGEQVANISWMLDSN